MTAAELKAWRLSHAPPEYVRQQRGPKPRHISQRQLARLIGVTRGTVSRMERGELPVTHRTSRAIAALAEQCPKLEPAS